MQQWLVLNLSLFAIPLGLAGLGGAWSVAHTDIGAPGWVQYVFYGASALFWSVFSIVYGWQQLRRHRTFTTDLKHPVTGPLTAYIPVIGILLTVRFGTFLPRPVQAWLCWILVIAGALTAARLLAHWLTGELNIGVMHPGYFLPVVAGPFIAAIGLAAVGSHYSALAAFGTGMFFWLVVGTLVMGRLVDRGPLPLPARPLLSILLSAPATGGIAWLVLNGGTPDVVAAGFLGVIIVLLLMQIALGGHFLPLQADIGLWAFTFPAASSSNFAMRWLAAVKPAGWAAMSWTILAVGTTIVLAIAAVTATALRRRPLSPPQR